MTNSLYVSISNGMYKHTKLNIVSKINKQVEHFIKFIEPHLKENKLKDLRNSIESFIDYEKINRIISENLKIHVTPKTTNKDGYLVNTQNKPIHRTIYAKHYCTIPPDNHIHHIDTDKKNNDPKNLIALKSELHILVHECQIKLRMKLNRNELIEIKKLYNKDVYKDRRAFIKDKIIKILYRKSKYREPVQKVSDDYIETKLEELQKHRI